MMPEMDGYEVLERCARTRRSRTLPVDHDLGGRRDRERRPLHRARRRRTTSPSRSTRSLLRARVGATLEKKRLRDARAPLRAKSLERELEIGREIQAELPARGAAAAAGLGDRGAASSRRARSPATSTTPSPLEDGARSASSSADVCDKGVGAALFMALFRSLLRAFARPGVHGAATAAPSASARRSSPTNDYIARTHGRSNMFATVFFGVLDPGDGRRSRGSTPATRRRSSSAASRSRRAAGADRPGARDDARDEVRGAGSHGSRRARPCSPSPTA